MTDKEIGQLAAALHKLRAGELGSVRSDLTEVKTSQSWHKMIGWWAIGLAGAAAITLFGLVLITIPVQIKTEIEKGRENSRQDTRGAISEGTIPLRESLAEMKATLDFMRQDASKKVADLMKENLKARDADLGLRAVGALAEKARESEVVGDPARLVSVGEIAIQLGQSNPKIAGVAFDTISHLASSLFSEPVSLSKYRIGR